MSWEKDSKKSWVSLMILATLTSLLLTGCSSTINANSKNQAKEEVSKAQQAKENSPSKGIINKTGETIKTRYNPPKGFKRVALEGKDFGVFLRDQKLMPYDENHCAEGVYDSILDVDIEPENVHQSSALMQMRAEYLHSQDRYEEIVFRFGSGFIAEYEEWMKGNRLDKQGGLVQWVQRGSASNKKQDLTDFMGAVFTYSDGLSIDKMLVPIKLEDMDMGDVFVRGGGVGQIAMVVDMAIHEETGEKIFILAQSSIVTKQTSVLLNPRDPERNPWYSQEMDEGLVTPEGKFVKSDLKGFE